MYNFSSLLETISEALDIPENYYEQAVKRYESIGAWLERDESIVAGYSPDIYPQGSFLIGTVTKPISDVEEYDIDLVSELSLQKNKISQAYLKNLVGDEIKSYIRENDINSPVEEGKRCWTLHYADDVQFHMDILPAIPDAEPFRQLLESKGYSPSNWSDSAIAITDRTHPNYTRIHPDWPCSNPRGYAEWFRSRMEIQFNAIRKSLAESIQLRVEDVPEYKVKTPLQRTIQILKRHRDIWFEVNKSDYDEEAKPISIIITTLAAFAYNNEADLQEALSNVVSNMHKHIKRDDNGITLIPNPVNPLENFADKWQEHPIRKECFIDWLKQAQSDLTHALEMSDIQSVGKSLKSCLGERVINEGVRNLPESKSVYVSTLSASIKPGKLYAQQKTIDAVISTMKITDDEIKWLESYFPTLQYEPSSSKIIGELHFCAAYDNRVGKLVIGEHARGIDRFIKDIFEIEIRLDSPDANGWPKVFEIGGRHHRISKKYNVPIIDLHFYPEDDSCCLGIKYGGNRNLCIKEFLPEQVIPFFYQLAYTAKFGIVANRKDLWGEYSHGKKGLVEYEAEMLNLAKLHPSRNDLCPCGSGKKYKKCHMDQVESVKRSRRKAASDVAIRQTHYVTKPPVGLAEHILSGERMR
ncbi:MAG: SEC-C metal-binding domain-containing protein [Candidatus Poribacteria bacterium]|nr:SEC-C metal-binding domain-containing protein [Candidatus Poribacteria bacterium]MDE0466225.1 SEC-C metal-binding domain-containing protein [Candidatus Poribacteria bacterium]